MTIHQVSFSVSVIARLGVPPGKWFCLARTGLGFSQYSCCVCGLHHGIFTKYWNESRNRQHDWEKRLLTAIDKTLIELKYGSSSQCQDVVQIRERIMSLIRDKDNYLVNDSFIEAWSLRAKGSIAILTDGPRCLVNTALPNFPSESIFSNKSVTTKRDIARISRVHVGTNLSDLLHVPQTKFIITRKPPTDIPSGIRVFPKLTTEVMQKILQTI